MQVLVVIDLEGFADVGYYWRIPFFFPSAGMPSLAAPA
jgi:hypothetical protein